MTQKKHILKLFDGLRDILYFHGRNENVEIITMVHHNANIFYSVNIEMIKK